jgi:hypothetical protein
MDGPHPAKLAIAHDPCQANNTTYIVGVDLVVGSVEHQLISQGFPHNLRYAVAK